MQLGQLSEYDISGMKVVHLTQDEFDEMQEKYKEKQGHYPDTYELR